MHVLGSPPKRFSNPVPRSSCRTQPADLSGREQRAISPPWARTRHESGDVPLGSRGSGMSGGVAAWAQPERDSEKACAINQFFPVMNVTLQ